MRQTYVMRQSGWEPIQFSSLRRGDVFTMAGMDSAYEALSDPRVSPYSGNKVVNVRMRSDIEVQAIARREAV